MAFRLVSLISYEATPRGWQGAALPFIKVVAERKVTAFPHSKAAEPQSISYVELTFS